MSRRLRKAAQLPVPIRVWSVAEWASLAAVTSTGMGQRWSVEVEDPWLALVRSGQHCIFQATTRALRGDERELVELLCEGDPDLFNRRGFADDADVAALFIRVTDGLLRPPSDHR